MPDLPRAEQPQGRRTRSWQPREVRHPVRHRQLTYTESNAEPGQSRGEAVGLPVQFVVIFHVDSLHFDWLSSSQGIAVVIRRQPHEICAMADPALITLAGWRR